MKRMIMSLANFIIILQVIFFMFKIECLWSTNPSLTDRNVEIAKSDVMTVIFLNLSVLSYK
ncbi:unnamed protein product [Trifolium pratense]|uniref:Uncharacterized protein n=1 Tax=Trifolium pratense TaxID=57577 RepID=A0ACB0KU10_TRIPR|nr:unnamed protein product [Trifolium pratense]